jgi:predicted Zn-dependent protease
MLQEDPGDALLYYMLANEYFKTGQYLECVQVMERYLRLAEDEGAAYRTLAQALTTLGRIAEARQVYEAGIRAAQKFGHPGMADEYQETLKGLE